MRQYFCECTECGKRCNVHFTEEPFPALGDEFLHQCPHCGGLTKFQRVATKKALSERRTLETETALRAAIEADCKERGLSCSFVYQSVVIKTPVCHWKFDYHVSRKTLWHESTYKINLKTGCPAARHKQFENRKMSWQQVIAYIYSHDKWRAEQHMGGPGPSRGDSEKFKREAAAL